VSACENPVSVGSEAANSDTSGSGEIFGEVFEEVSLWAKTVDFEVPVGLTFGD
jgi:hypothetical protein